MPYANRIGADGERVRALGETLAETGARMVRKSGDRLARGTWEARRALRSQASRHPLALIAAATAVGALAALILSYGRRSPVVAMRRAGRLN